MNLERLAAKYRESGAMGSARSVLHALRVTLDMAALEVLRRRFGFDLWHARSPDSARAYRKQLGRLVSDLNPACVVEVGCGLGGILPSIKARQRSGYDRDPAVIRAARFLHPGSIRFVEGGFGQVTEPHIDVLIAVNWIHDFSPAQLERWLAPLLPRTDYLLVDAIDPGTAGYSHHHDFAFLAGEASAVTIRVDDEPNRRFILWKLPRF